MAAKSDTGVIEKVFEHCEITWKIENYILATFKKNWIVNGPDIYIREPKTKWKMILTPDYTKDSVCVKLQRLDPGLDTILVYWRVAIVEKPDVKYFQPDRKFYVSPKSFCSVNFRNDDIVNRLPPLKDTLNIWCELIVCQKEDPKKFKGIELISLTQNLRLLYEDREYDIVIINKGVEIKAHRAVLNRHSANLGRKISQEADSISLNLDMNALVKVLLYLYTNNLQFVLSEPSFPLVECLAHLHINATSLLYYVPDIVTLNTSLDVQDYQFKWVIENVRFRTEDTIYSPIFDAGISETCWNFQLNLARMDGWMSMSITAHIGGNVNTMCVRRVFVEFVALNSDHDIISKSSRKPELLKGNAMIHEDNIFHSRLSQISSLLPDNKLHITFKIQILHSETVNSRKSRSMWFTNSE